MKYRYVNTEYGSLRSSEIRSIMLCRCRSPGYCMNSTGSVLIGSSVEPDGDASATAAIASADAIASAIAASADDAADPRAKRKRRRGTVYKPEY